MGARNIAHHLVTRSNNAGFMFVCVIYIYTYIVGTIPLEAFRSCFCFCVNFKLSFNTNSPRLVK